MTARKPCFECNDNEQDDMSIGECLESPLCTSKDENGCSHINSGRHWEDCGFGARSEEHPAFLAKKNMTQCPCCKGSGFVGAEAQMIDINRLERRIKYRDEDEPLLPPSPEEVLALIAEIRRLRGENKMLYQMVDDAIAMAAHRRIGLLGPDAREHRRCPCGGEPEVMKWKHGRRSIKCDICDCGTDYCDTPEEAWAAWDGVE